jgi:cell division protein FtsB
MHDATLEQRVEMWKRAFEVERDENIKLKLRIAELEARVADLDWDSLDVLESRSRE